MTNLNDEIITQIKNKAEMESLNIAKAVCQKNRALTKEEVLQQKSIYTSEELDFVINNYQNQHESCEFLENCLFLLDKYKQTKQPSKCTAIYKILNKYFSIVNCYDEPFSNYAQWEGFEIVPFMVRPTVLEDIVKKSVEKIKYE